MIGILVTLAAEAAAIPARTPLATVPVAPAKTVARIEATRVDFSPGQIMPRHKHTVPVICSVTKGAFLTSIGDAGEKPVHAGDVTYEPAGVVVRYFQNASLTEPAQLLCMVLAGESDSQINVMLRADEK